MPIFTIKPQVFKKIAITTGDPSGVGFEVAVKALIKIRRKKSSALFFIFRDHKQHLSQPGLFKLLDRSFTRITFYDLSLALQFAKNLHVSALKKNKYIIDLSLSSSAADWVVIAANACLKKDLDSLVTAPLSKTLIKSSGYSELGHTGLFRKIFPKALLYMAFVGKDFNVLLATDHIQLKNVDSSLSCGFRSLQ